jgi:transposase InsO family protein
MGEDKTKELIRRNFWWPKINEEIIRYVQSCPECQRNKAVRHKAYGLLQPLEPAYAPWQSFAMDFISDLSLSEECDQLWMIINRYTKMAHFIPLKKNNKKAEDITTIFVREIWRLHGIPADIISDRDSRFTSKFWKSLITTLGIRPRMSTTFHPPTHGQPEGVNQTIETFLRSVINLQQTDWVELLPLAEFAYNNSTTSAHGMTPFYANYGYHPSTGTTPTETNILSANLVAYGHWMKAVVENCKKELEKTSKQMKKYVEQSRIEPPSFEPGNLVMLNEKHIRSRRPARNLDHMMYGPFEILGIISPTAVRLRLPKMWKIHPVFHGSLIEPFVKGNQDVDLNAFLKNSDLIENASEYDVDKVLGSTEKDGKVLSLVKWKSWPAKKHSTREPFDSFYSVGAKEELRVFHPKNLDTRRDSRLTDSE